MTLGALAPSDPAAGVAAVSEATARSVVRSRCRRGTLFQRLSPPQVTLLTPYSRRVGVWNTFVEGDNLDVLRSMVGRECVDLIYIDPPYNTGNAFAYRDDYRGGEWVAMMRPRLVAAREVLSETGAIFVSIDDNEQARLRLLMDEIFGPANFLAQVVVNLNAKGRQLGKGFATSHEYLLAYARDVRQCVLDAS